MFSMTSRSGHHCRDLQTLRPGWLVDVYGRADGITDIGERAILLVQEHKFPLPVLGARHQRVHLRIHVPV